MTKWCLLSNPSVYDVERAIHALPVVHWNLGRLQRALPTPGDPVLVWRTLGGDRRRGLIGQGVIDGDIALIPDDQDPFWLDPERGLEVDRRVPVRWWPFDPPIWLDEEPTVLGALKVARSQGLSMVAEEPDTWDAAARLAVSQPALLPSEGSSRGQGWLTSVEQRLVVETAGMSAATAHYDAGGYSVEDVHLREPYDLRCTRGNDEVHVEVKSTTGSAEYILLTRGEVVHARQTAHAALFVLTGVRLRTVDEKLVTDASDEPVIIDPWLPGDRDLSPLSYTYRIR